MGLRHTTTFDISDGIKRPSPEYASSFLSQILMAWFEPTVWKARNKPIDKKDLWDLNAEDR